MSDTILALANLGRDLNAAVEALDTTERQSVAADSAYKLAFAKAYLNADGSVDARKALADVHCAALYEQRETAAAAVRVQRERLKQLHARVDVGRSILSAERHLAAVGT